MEELAKTLKCRNSACIEKKFGEGWVSGREGKGNGQRPHTEESLKAMLRKVIYIMEPVLPKLARASESLQGLVNNNRFPGPTKDPSKRPGNLCF